MAKRKVRRLSAVRRTRRRPVSIDSGTAEERPQTSVGGYAVQELRLWDGPPCGLLSVNPTVIESSIAAPLRKLGFGDGADGLATALSSLMLSGLADHVERYLNIEVGGAPFELFSLRVASRPEFFEPYCDQLLQYLEDLLGPRRRRDILRDIAALPFARFVRRVVGQRGTSSQRKRLRRIWGRIPKGEPGRPVTLHQDRRHVVIAHKVEEAKQRLAPGFQAVRERRQTRSFGSDDEMIRADLKALDAKYQPKEIKALLDGRTLSGAANRLVASQLDMDVRVVSAMVARGRRRRT